MVEYEMGTGEWLSLLGILLAGFGFVIKLLWKIVTGLEHAVTHDQCARKRDKCPCIRDIDALRRILDIRQGKE